MLLRTILFHISNIRFRCHVISNYFVGNSPFSVDFDWTVMNDTTSRSLDYINNPGQPALRKNKNQDNAQSPRVWSKQRQRPTYKGAVETKTTPNLQGCGRSAKQKRQRRCPTSKGEANEAGFSSKTYFYVSTKKHP